MPAYKLVEKFKKAPIELIEEKLASSTVASFLPEAIVVLVARPWHVKKWYIKTRLGQAAPARLTLHRVMEGVDPAYGGRWNAGNNKRAGGTDIEPEEYAKMVNERVEKALNQLKQ